MSELAKRVAFSVIAIPAALAILWAGDWLLAALLAILAALAAWEFFRIAREAGLNPLTDLGIVLAGIAPLIAHAARLGVFVLPGAGVAVIALAVFAAALWLRGPDGRPIGAVAATLFGVAYTGGMLAFGYALRYHDYAIGATAGSALVAFPLILTWTSDIAAYFVGRALGRRKLMPSVSPGKTVAGAVGALVFSVVVSIVYARWALPPLAHLSMRPLGAALFGLVISVAAQVGDLCESLIKRAAAVKDSSHLIPGHGGVLDRIDSLLFVLPTAYLIIGSLLIPVPV